MLNEIVPNYNGIQLDQTSTKAQQFPSSMQVWWKSVGSFCVILLINQPTNRHRQNLCGRGMVKLFFFFPYYMTRLIPKQRYHSLTFHNNWTQSSLAISKKKKKKCNLSSPMVTNTFGYSISNKNFKTTIHYANRFLVQPHIYFNTLTSASVKTASDCKCQLHPAISQSIIWNKLSNEFKQKWKNIII